MLSQRPFRLPKDIPLEEYPSPETFLDEARRLTQEAQRQGLILRVMGPIALHFYFPEFADLYQQMERLGDRVFTDIDYVSYGKHRGKMVSFFEKQGYEIEKRSQLLSGGARHIYYGGRVPMVDVFYDSLSYNHPIDFHGRLEFHPYCISLADLLLQKLQIVQINDKDLKDAMLLLLAGALGATDGEGVNTQHIARILSEDWGFYYTATMNLGRVVSTVDAVAALSEPQRAFIREKAHQVLRRIEETPKSGKWKKRAEVGPKKVWYDEVTDWD